MSGSRKAYGQIQRNPSATYEYLPLNSGSHSHLFPLQRTNYYLLLWYLLAYKIRVRSGSHTQPLPQKPISSNKGRGVLLDVNSFFSGAALVNSIQGTEDPMNPGRLLSSFIVPNS